MPVNKKALASMTDEELKEYKREWYSKNKEKVQKARLIKGLKNNQSNRNLKPETLDKYGIEVTKDNRVVIPEITKLRFNHTNVATTLNQKPNIINVVVKQDSPIQQYDAKNAKLNYKDLKDFIATGLPQIPPKLSVSVKNAYARLPAAIFEMYNEPIDEYKDLTEWLTNAGMFIEAIMRKKSWKTDSSRSKNLGQFLRLAQDFAPYKAALSEDDKNTLQAQADAWGENANAINKVRTESTYLFEFYLIKDAVLNKYGKYSYEYLYFTLYDSLIPRDDLNSLSVAYNENEMLTTGNYLFINTNKNEGTIILTEFKTKDKYLKKTYPLTVESMDIIKNLHSKEEQPVRKLFVGLPEKLTNWVFKITTGIEGLNKDSIGIKYLRKSAISSRLLKLKNSSMKDRAEEMVKVAGLSMNSVRTQQNSYVSPLKRLNGKPFITPKKLKEVNEAIDKEVNHYYNTRSKGKQV